MSIRFRKSVKLGPGIRLNVGKAGVSSVSFGGAGFHYNVGRSGRRSTTVGISGTGLSHTSRRVASRRAAQVPPNLPPPPKPGFLAPSHEKRYHEAIAAWRLGEWEKAEEAFRAASAAKPDLPSPYLFGALLAGLNGREEQAVQWLEGSCNTPGCRIP